MYVHTAHTLTIHPLIVEQHPVVALLILWAVVWAVVLGIAPRGFAAPLWSSAVTTRALPATLIAGFIASMVWYGCKATYFDAAEPTITAVAAMFKAGRPLYPGLDAPERYVHVYCPIVFVAHALSRCPFGASLGPPTT